MIAAFQKIAFVGIGRMGSRIALNLIRAGHPVSVYARSPEKTTALAAAGATVAGSLAEVATNADVVFTMVSDSNALLSVVAAPDGILAGLKAGAILVDMSTVDPAVSRQVAAAVRGRGADMLDAPVSGSTMMAEQGTLTLMVGGDAAVYQRLRPLLLTIGNRVTHVGPNGAGASLKLAVNIVIGVTVQVLSESIVLAERAGIDPAVAIDVLSNSAVASPLLKYKAAQLLDPTTSVAFTANMMQKDFVLALQMARDLGVPLPTTAAANEIVTVARGIGWGDHDFAVVAAVLRQLSTAAVTATGAERGPGSSRQEPTPNAG